MVNSDVDGSTKSRNHRKTV